MAKLEILWGVLEGAGLVLLIVVIGMRVRRMMRERQSR
jgi:hypothetical protein